MKFKCPNCKQKMYLDKEEINKDCGRFGICDVWHCEDCSHIYLLDWRGE